MLGTRNGRSGDVDLERDLELVDRCQHGDSGAFEDLYMRYQDRLHRYCLGRLSDAAEADDAVQETFARAWKALPSFAGERHFYPWLTVIASNLCVDMNLKRSRWSPVEEETLDLLAPSVIGEQDTLIERTGERDILSRALTNLSARHREVLELREGKNWTYQQIASFEGVEVSAIETLLFRARRSLRREFMQLARAEGALGVVLAPLFFLRRAGARALSAARVWAAGAKGVLAGVSVSGGAAIGGTAAALATTVLVTGSIVALASTPHRSTTQPQGTALVRAATLGSATVAASGAGGSRVAHVRQLPDGRPATRPGPGGAGQLVQAASGVAASSAGADQDGGGDSGSGSNVGTKAVQTASAVTTTLLHDVHQILDNNPVPAETVTKVVKSVLHTIPVPKVTRKVTQVVKSVLHTIPVPTVTKVVKSVLHTIPVPKVTGKVTHVVKTLLQTIPVPTVTKGVKKVVHKVPLPTLPTVPTTLPVTLPTVPKL
jgi:RNA polymerase sigma-70 factor (ECF subfamily)